jgi:hypothetical protein
MRARTYDPATAQFLTIDPAVSLTQAPYNYASDDPLNGRDRTGLKEETVYCYPWGCVSIPGGNGGGPGQGVGEIVEKNLHEFEGGAEHIGNGVASIWDEVTGGGGKSQGGSGGGESAAPTPPGYNPETWRKGSASREKEAGENYHDPEGGEWHWHPPDPRHPEYPEGHWDYKPGSPWNAEWQRLPPC